MNRGNGKMLAWTMRNVVLVAGLLIFASGCGNSDIPGLADLKKNVETVLKTLTDTMAKVKDKATAEAALPDLTKADETLAKITPLFEKLPKAGQDQIIAIVKEVFANLKKAYDAIKDKIDLPKFASTVTDILKKLGPLAGQKG